MNQERAERDQKKARLYDGGLMNDSLRTMDSMEDLYSRERT